WRLWNHMPAYASQLFERARRSAPEPAHHAALGQLVEQAYQPGDSLLDIGCGAGDFYRTLHERVDPVIAYTGMDPTERFIELARQAATDLPGSPEFALGDVLDIPLGDASHDIVVCSAVLAHVPPPPTGALSELLRVARKWVIIRTVCGARNYLIKELKSPDEYARNGITRSELEAVTNEQDLQYYNYFNLYTEAYYRAAIEGIDPTVEMQFLRAPELGHTESGSLKLDWTAIVIAKRPG
ncbi:MAG: methyltransferase domain-containing protein, partial [Myxococcales bacterium]|nr:methyltransferase domain-containing protein [Myxococcales bacterium]